MADFIKKKIVEKLAKFTKHLKPSDISLSFLSGKGHLSNLELNGDVISEILQLPPWVVVSKVVCDTIKAKVPFTSITTDPVNFYIGQVLVEITTSTNTTSATATNATETGKLLLDKLGNNPSKYSLIEKVIDGMRVEVRSVLVFFNDPTFHAQLEVTDILIESSSWEWKLVPLNKARVRNEDEDSIINYKVCSWSSLKIEGWSTTQGEATSHNQLRLIVGASKTYITFKRNMSDSSIMSSRIVLSLGDLIWILTQSQLRAVSHLVQSLMDAAVRTYQQREEGEGVESDSEGSMESVSSDRGSHKASYHANKMEDGDKKMRKSQKKKSKSSAMKNKLVQERISQYREGKLNLPSYEVIQNSFHVKTGKVDLQLCDDMSGADMTDTVQGSMLIQIFELAVDVYLDQPAGVGRAHWNRANDIIDNNKRWSNKLITAASKTQFVELPSVNLSYLRERGIVVRCSDFIVGALRKGGKKKSWKDADLQTLPIITSDKATFNIPDDVHNPALQVGVTLYFYPDKYGNKFLIPRPNMLLYMSPVHVNVHQESCLWLVEFVHGLVKTVNIQLALTVKDEGKSFLEEKMAQSVQTERVPGVDMKVKILFTKVTLPLPGAAKDGRPKALQIETAAIKAKNCPLNKLRVDPHFIAALQAVKEGWLYTSQESKQFPHYQEDLRALSARLQELLSQEVRVGRRRGESCSEESSGTSSTALAPEENRSEMVSIEGWYVTTSCVHVAFANSYTHKATLNAKTFIDDFPVHVWLFLPPSSPDASLPSSPSHQPLDPPGSQPMDPQPPPSVLLDPRFSIIAHVPSEIRAELERLQLLFIMRLKDSFTSFKTSLMKFLDPNTFAPHLKETLEAHRLANKEADMEPDTPTVTISGCIVFNRVEASILLPTLHTSAQDSPTEAAPSDQPYDQHSTAHMPFMATQAATPSRISPDLEESISAGPPPHPLSTGTSPGTSPAPTRASSISVLSHSNTETSLISSPASLLSLPDSPSPSLVSLPVIVEGSAGMSNQYKGTCTSTTDLNTKRNWTVPARSLSAVELPRHVLEGVAPSLDTGVPSVQDKEKDASLTEEEFILVKYPSPSKMPASPTVLVQETSCSNQPSGAVDDGIVPSPSSSGDPLLSGTDVPPSSGTDIPPSGTDVPPSGTDVPPSSGTDVPPSSGTDIPPLSGTALSGSIPPSSNGVLPPSLSPSVRSPSTRSTSSERRVKSPPPLRAKPQFVLHAQVDNILALPNIRAGEIAVKLSVGTVALRELSVTEHQGMKELYKKKTDSVPSSLNSVPTIKARLEVGDQVGRFYPSECAKEQDIILIAKAAGLDLSLLLPNITIMKDFFDDEYEAVLPLPLHLKVATTRAVLVEDLAHSADHVQSMAIGVEQLELHRGRELRQEADIFLESSTNAISRHDSTVPSPEIPHPLEDTDDQLLHSFSDFISVFESHVQQHGHVQLPQPQRIAELLQELQSALLPVKPSVSPPPTYAEVAPYSYLHSSVKRSSTELLHLRRENEQLRQVQRQCERLSAQLKESQVEMGRRETDLMMVTDECKKTKEELVSYKQVMEKQQEHIEKLLTENFDLQRQLLAPT